MYSHIQRLSIQLISIGLEKCMVALVGKNSYEWLVAFLAICNSGNTAVLIDADAPDEEWLRCVKTCPVRWSICDQDLEERVQQVFGENYISLRPRMLEAYGDADEEACDFPEIPPESKAAVIFTSGTTGENKGVLLSHRNLCSDIQASKLLAGVDEKDDILAVLPPHHAFQLVTGLLTPYYSGMCIYFGRGIKYLKKDLAECRPSYLVLVPVIVRSLEKKPLPRYLPFRSTASTIDPLGISLSAEMISPS